METIVAVGHWSCIPQGNTHPKLFPTPKGEGGGACPTPTQLCLGPLPEAHLPKARGQEQRASGGSQQPSGEPGGCGGSLTSRPQPQPQTLPRTSLSASRANPHSLLRDLSQPNPHPPTGTL